jgi:CRP/FNR family transcriptional regulator, cyclic AMP receptor protein
MTHPALPRERLHEIPLLKNFTSDEAGQLLGIAETVEFEPGAIVLAEDKESSNLWIVLDGTCEIVKKSDQTGRQVALAEVQANQHFGEMSFFHPAPHSASVRAKTAVKLLRIGRREYDHLVDGQCPAAYKLAFNTIGGLAERLRRATDRLADLDSAEPSIKPPSEWSTFRSKMFDAWNL